MKSKSTLFGFILGILSLVSLTLFPLFADEKPQILRSLSEKGDYGGSVEVIQSSQIDNLLWMQMHNNRLQDGKILGYRISIFSESGQTARERAIQARSTFVRNFPGIEAYLEYNNPNFQLFVGDFRTRNDALKELKRIERSFPRAFIVRVTIQTSKNP